MARVPFEKRFAEFLRIHPHIPESEAHFVEMLRASFPGEAQQTGAVIVAWKAGIAEQIRPMRTVSSGFASSFARHLKHDRHMNPELADWAVRLWIIAYARDVLGRDTDLSGFGDEDASQKKTKSVVSGEETARADIHYRSFMGSKIVEGCGYPLPAALVVPDRHEDMPVRSIAARAFRETSIRFVIFGANVRSIGDEAFSECLDLVQAVFPKGLESIGPLAFANCERLQAAELPDTLKQIGGGAFAGTMLNKAVIPNSVRDLGASVFEACASLGEADVGLGIHDLPKRTFAGCTELTNVDLPAHLERIESEAFYGCISLKQIRIPDSVKHIEDGAFFGAGPELSLVGRRRSAAEYFAKRTGIHFVEFF